MKKFLVLLLLVPFLSSCDILDPLGENDNGHFAFLSVEKIGSIKTEGRRVTAEVIYTRPTPGYIYKYTLSSKNDSVYRAKLRGYYDGEITPQVEVRDTLTETIVFNAGGTKKIRYWNYEDRYIDTTVILH